MKLYLSDGTVFSGRPFGAAREVAGEVVFNTGMIGYVETLTDPSYRGQILVATYPLQGNYGVPNGPYESPNIQVEGLIVAHYSAAPSHHAATRRLGDWLKAENIPAIEAVDTRALTRRLREHGTMQGYLLEGETDLEEAKGRVSPVEMKRVAELVTGREIVRHAGQDLSLLVIDTGAKETIIRSLQKRGASLIVAPFVTRWEPLLDEVDGVMLTNGPGDPADLSDLVGRLRSAVLSRNIPVFGICLGHQLLALAAGARTYKLKYGHRSHNQPVMELASRRSFVTSQNHGYAVEERLPSDWQPWFVNLNDGTNEGIHHRYRPFRSVQFHPEATAGPRDTGYLFDEFLHIVGEMRGSQKVRR
jgi:carbamoyl-phosphate synthase small subunit